MVSKIKQDRRDRQAEEPVEVEKTPDEIEADEILARKIAEEEKENAP